MAQLFQSGVMTAKGIALLAEVQAGNVGIEFTRMAIGDGSYEDDDKETTALQAMTALKNERNFYTFSNKEVVDDNTLALTALLTNCDTETLTSLVDEGYYINELAIFAKATALDDDDESSYDEVMYSIAVTAGDTGDFMPPYSGSNPAQIVQTYYTTITNAEGATVSMAGAAYLSEDGEALEERVTAAEESIAANASDIDALENVADELDSDSVYVHGISGGIPYIALSGASASERMYLITQEMEEGTYDGRNLADIFSAEIASYSDEWEWIKDRITEGYMNDIFTCDYIPIETTDGYSFDMQVMGINTYIKYGSTEIGNMIDFCSRTVHPTTTVFNEESNNNGSEDNANPFMASYLKNTFLDTVVYPTLPSTVTAQMSGKQQLLENRYSSSGTLTDSTTSGWQTIDGLWVPAEVETTSFNAWGTNGFSCEGFIWYPYFRYKHNQCKKNPSGTRCTWWLATARGGNSAHACIVNASGYLGTANISTKRQAPICFRIAAE